MTKVRETQLEAFDAIQDVVGDRRRAVLDHVTTVGGATLFELVDALGLPVNRISGRVTELTRMGCIMDGGERRVNPASGRRAIVWVPMNIRPVVDL